MTYLTMMMRLGKTLRYHVEEREDGSGFYGCESVLHLHPSGFESLMPTLSDNETYATKEEAEEEFKKKIEIINKAQEEYFSKKECLKMSENKTDTRKVNMTYLPLAIDLMAINNKVNMIISEINPRGKYKLGLLLPFEHVLNFCDTIKVMGITVSYSTALTGEQFDIILTKVDE
jgi:hypothetical protein